MATSIDISIRLCAGHQCQLNKYVIESNGSTEYTIFDLSDETGYIYPDIEIEVNDNCDVIITNTHENRTF